LTDSVVSEILPGLFRIGGKLGDRFFYQYLFLDEKSLLVDTGIPATANEVILPAFHEIGLRPSDLDFVLVTHADVDHFGGNRVIKRHALKANFIAHELDAPFIENKRKILEQRYGWYAKYGIAYPPKTWSWLNKAAGDPIPLDLHLSGEMSLRIGKERKLKLLHLPGHSEGHMGVYDEGADAAVIGDSILGNGLFNTTLELIAPPPYVNVEAYENTIGRIQSLNLQHLLTGHYPTFRGKEIAGFLEESIHFVKRLGQQLFEALKEDHGGLELKDLLADTDRRLGPFRAFSNELASSIRAHLLQFEAQKKIGRRTKHGKTIWYLIR